MTSEAPAITLDELRRKAERVRELSEEEFRRLTTERLSRTIGIAAVAAVVLVSAAYMLGARRR
ncbi:MAG: hypothetical protein WC971_05280 [Coriobacteriia bacterium]